MPTESDLRALGPRGVYSLPQSCGMSWEEWVRLMDEYYAARQFDRHTWPAYKWMRDHNPHLWPEPL